MAPMDEALERELVRVCRLIDVLRDALAGWHGDRRENERALFEARQRRDALVAALQQRAW